MATTTTLDEVWALFREVAEAQKETGRRFQESDRRFQETERLMKEQSKETERFMKERSKENDRRMKQLSEQLGRLGNRLGEFVEEMVKPAVVRLFRERGIVVHEVHQDVEVERGGEGIQIDLLVVNDTEAVLVEVKSKLVQTDVEMHMERLGKFKRLLPRYGDIRVMGAVAAMVVPKDVARYAYRQGLFVLAQSGESVVILNDGGFKPNTW
jgi:hypothetical protein